MPSIGRDELIRRSRKARDLAAAIGGLVPPEQPGARDGVEAWRVRLFVNAPGGVPLPPYGGWWIEGRLGGDHGREVAATYAREGLQIEPGAGPPDALTAELEFLAFLLRHQLAARDTGRAGLEAQSLEREREFLERFLLPWIPRFCARGREIAAGTPWAATFGLLQALVLEEARRVGCSEPREMRTGNDPPLR